MDDSYEMPLEIGFQEEVVGDNPITGHEEHGVGRLGRIVTNEMGERDHSFFDRESNIKRQVKDISAAHSRGVNFNITRPSDRHNYAMNWNEDEISGEVYTLLETVQQILNTAEIKMRRAEHMKRYFDRYPLMVGDYELVYSVQETMRKMKILKKQEKVMRRLYKDFERLLAVVHNFSEAHQNDLSLRHRVGYDMRVMLDSIMIVMGAVHAYAGLFRQTYNRSDHAIRVNLAEFRHTESECEIDD